ncbi:hypothetical protein L1987_60462 [Smallanthus sonchifolius]|uniref:Uncharacterized protein n=1 Tax=Smallanthus sonchifolius TaxID=185202 RepID=A0ACB9D8Y6_9ASTR|nr:hypothetical protein L1987_60462 [Smallanthus sonchifolius]
MAAVSSFTLSGTPRTVEEIFTDYSSHRNGLIRALTHDVDELHGLCDPVSPPSETVRPELPEPTLGINFARDSMSRRDWLFLIAVHRLRTEGRRAKPNSTNDEDNM